MSVQWPKTDDEVRFVGGPLDGKVLAMRRPWPDIWRAPWPMPSPTLGGFELAMIVGPMVSEWENPTAIYRLEKSAGPFGVEIRYVCPDRKPPLG